MGLLVVPFHPTLLGVIFKIEKIILLILGSTFQID